MGAYLPTKIRIIIMKGGTDVFFYRRNKESQAILLR